MLVKLMQSNAEISEHTKREASDNNESDKRLVKTSRSPPATSANQREWKHRLFRSHDLIDPFRVVERRGIVITRLHIMNGQLAQISYARICSVTQWID